MVIRIAVDGGCEPVNPWRLEGVGCKEREEFGYGYCLSQGRVVEQ